MLLGWLGTHTMVILNHCMISGDHPIIHGSVIGFYDA